MGKPNVNRSLVAALFVVVAVLAYGLIGEAGNLEPPAGPAPTMKTLDEVEARIPIPGSSSPTVAFVVSSAGSYYLTGDRYTNDDGIVVSVDNVTIDLNGYNLIGSGTNSGVYMRMKNNVEIRNGTVRNFERGIYESDTSGKNHRVINIRTSSNSLDGIHLKGSNHLVKDCMVSDNGTSASSDVYGIYVGNNSMVTGNTASDNGTSATSDTLCGIYAGDGSTVTGNTAHNNGTSAINETLCGIFAGNGSTITGNTAYGNGILADNSFLIVGFFSGNGSTVIGNTARNNGDSAINGIVYGIYLSGYNLVDQNTAFSNGSGTVSPTNIPLTIPGCVYGNNVAP